MIINKYIFDQKELEDDSILFLKINCDSKVRKRLDYCNSINNFLIDYKDEYKILATSDKLFLEKI
jgi:hypothetical protein